MRTFNSILGLVTISALSTAAWATTAQDPRMAMEEADFSQPLLLGATFNATNGGGTIGFFNPFPTFVTAVGFRAQLLRGITFGQGDIADLTVLFQCNQSSDDIQANPFFQNCSFNYNSLTGALDIRFFNPVLDRAGAPTGIPQLPSDCNIANADTPRCEESGHFAIVLDDLGVPDPPHGGWSSDANPDLFPTGQAHFFVNEIAIPTGDFFFTPEPSTLFLFGAGLLVVANSVKRKRRSQNS